jgi:anti-sigma regulatory factor (Ser/Thr protein kinase)
MMARLEIVLANQIAEVGRLAGILDQFAADHAVPSEMAYCVSLSLDEIVSNVIRHGYDRNAHQIIVRLALDDHAMTVQVEDEGAPFDPLAEPPPDFDRSIEERGVGGLGIHIVRHMMDGFEYHRDGNRNVLTLTKRAAD